MLDGVDSLRENRRLADIDSLDQRLQSNPAVKTLGFGY
jgi:hypothetical protein